MKHGEERYKLVALKRSAIAISSVVVVELILGSLAGSLAIISDGLHALLDALTTSVLFYATRLSMKPPDEEHMYGHARFEAIGGLIGGIALVGTGILIMYEAVIRLASGEGVGETYQFAGFAAIAFTFGIDFFRVGSFIRTRKSESATLKAGLYHAAADLSSTIIAFIGFGLATVGIRFGDSVASMILSVLLTFLSLRLIWESSMELSDAVSRDVAMKVRRTLRECIGISNYRDLRIRRAGSKTYLEITLEVPDYMSLEEGHELASRVEKNVKNAIGEADVTIHIEPKSMGMPTEKLVEKLATEVEGVKEVHEVSAVCEEDKLYVTLHAYVDSKLPVKEAHEKAEKIESKITKGIKHVENVTVHIEPSSARKHVGPKIDEAEARKIIQEIAEKHPGAFLIRRIVTYVAHKKRYISIDCVFSKQVTIEEAHEISSQIEENVSNRFAETTVTVHMEPEPT